MGVRFCLYHAIFCLAHPSASPFLAFRVYFILGEKSGLASHDKGAGILPPQILTQPTGLLRHYDSATRNIRAADIPDLNRDGRVTTDARGNGEIHLVQARPDDTSERNLRRPIPYRY